MKSSHTNACPGSTLSNRWSTGWRAALALGAMLALSASSVGAQEIHVTVNGQPVHFAGLGPQQIEGRTLVPVRGVLEQLGADVAWVPQTRSVIASNGKVDIQLHLGDRHATVNGKEVLLDVPAQEIGGHTMVPLRFLGEALGADVGWDGPSRTVVIVTQDQGGQQPALHRTPTPEFVPHPEEHRPNINPVINNFSANAKGWLREGQDLRVTMDGTPGGQASFRLPGLAEYVPMQEEAPGHYVGTWRVPEHKPVHLADAAVIGNLKLGDRSAPLIQAGQTVSVDTIPPRVRDRAPDPDSRVSSARPNISAVFDDQGSGIDRNSIRMLIDGHDVTSDATITRDFISYTPTTPLPPGPKNVRIVVANNAGNQTESAWTFTEAPREMGGIKSVNDNVNKILEPGDVLHVEMAGSPGGASTFTLGSIKDVKMQETMPGRYVGDYTIRKGDDVSRAPVAVRLITPDGQKFVQQGEHVATVSTGKPMDPVITFPGAKDAISSPLTVRGKATPNTQVHVKVSYASRVLGLMALNGTASDTVVTADKDGNWKTDPINLSGLLPSRNVEYTITATSTNLADQKSGTTAFKFHLR